MVFPAGLANTSTAVNIRALKYLRLIIFFLSFPSSDKHQSPCAHRKDDAITTVEEVFGERPYYGSGETDGSYVYYSQVFPKDAVQGTDQLQPMADIVKETAPDNSRGSLLVT